jgi:Uncharacterized protein conserved in bacteria
MALAGVHHHSLGPRGRLIIPSKLRRSLGQKFVAVAAFDCLELFPLSRWEDIEKGIRELPPFSKETEDLINHLGSRTAICAMDKQGRSMIPLELCEAIGIKGDVVSVGAVDRIRVWPKDEYERRSREVQTSLDTLREVL